ncbi:MAG: CoA transferase [Pseudomonadales bacterium]|nr:CoA transferase [Pseudomonadales bacterium]
MLLEGITVLDLTRVVAGPACTRTLADLGAEVIKIEPPEGDLLRGGVPKVGGVAVGFAQQNVGKRLLSIDLAQARGRDLVRALAAQADVLVENYRPGVAARLGIGYEDIRAIRPDIIYCSISGYGQSGPAAGRRAYAPVIHAELGLIELGARERGMDPLPEPVSHVDFAAGAQAASAILAALVGRLRGGGGQHVDVSMAETMLAVNEFTAVEVNGGFGDEISPFRPGRAALLRFGDGTWVQVPGNPTTWVFGVARALGKEAELEARGWLTPRETQGKESEINALMQSWAAAYDSVAAFESALDSARIPLGTVKALASVPDEPWAQQRGVFVDVELNGARARVPRSPFRFSATEVGPRAGAGLQGADNRAVLRERLGLDDTALAELEASGVLVSR